VEIGDWGVGESFHFSLDFSVVIFKYLFEISLLFRILYYSVNILYIIILIYSIFMRLYYIFIYFKLLYTLFQLIYNMLTLQQDGRPETSPVQVR
jgi:hypothetical protein